MERFLKDQTLTHKQDKAKDKAKGKLKDKTKDKPKPTTTLETTSTTMSTDSSPTHEPFTLEPFPTPSPPQLSQATATAQEVTRTLMPLLDARFTELKTAITLATKQIQSNTNRIIELEQRQSTSEDSIATQQTTIQNQQTMIQTLQDKLDDLENRSRRNNLRFIGIPESIPPQDLIAMLQQWLPEALQLKKPHDRPIIERAHRLGPESANIHTRPRQTIAKFLNFLDKEAILQAFRKNRQLTFRGQRILIFQDYSAQLSAKRREFTPICKVLSTHRIKFTLLYPAKLKITHNGTIEIFDNTQQAKDFLATNQLENNT